MKCRQGQRATVIRSVAGNEGRIVRTVELFHEVEEDCAPAWIVVSEGSALNCVQPQQLQGEPWVRDAWLEPLPDETLLEEDHLAVPLSKAPAFAEAG